jgi:mycoketide-CoA synthase
VPAGTDPDGTVLITGGTGTLGALVAEHLARTGQVRHLVLVSRRGPEAPGAGELVTRLAELGAAARLVAADVTDGAAVADVVGGIGPAHPLTGVVHAAGVLDDATVTALSPERLLRVWETKAAAAHHLHAATAGLRLGMFVLFSSSAATLGSPGQGNYAAANAFCDALAVSRQAAGLPAASIGWGLWASSSGMTGHLGEADLARLSRSGIGALSSEHGLDLFDAARRHGVAHLLAVSLDVRALAAEQAGTPPPLLRALITGGTARRAAAAVPDPGDLAGRLAPLSGDERSRVLLDLVRTHASMVLGHADAAAVPAQSPLKDLGFDSLTAVELRNRLSAATGLRLPATFVFRHPTPSAIAEYLREELCPAVADPDRPVFAELERLESVMAGFTPGGDDRDRLVERLETLLWRLGDGVSEAGQAVRGDALADASDDELFELIDREVSS